MNEFPRDHIVVDSTVRLKASWVSFFHVMLLGSILSMPSTSTCNKCKVGAAQEGDTWCLGCSALDLCQTELRHSWHSPAVRAIAEECTLSCARLVKAFGNLDRGLAASSAAQIRANATTQAKASPAPSGHRSRSREPRDRERAVDKRAPERAERPPLPTGDSYEEYSESEEPGESDKEPPAEERRAEKAAPAPPRAPAHSHHQPRGGKGHQGKGKKKTRRGGKKHQRHTRALTDPLRRVHRPLDRESVRLAPNFREGLERRA